MSRVQWNRPGERFYEAGVDRGVFYPRGGPGVAWNGLISVSEDASGGEIEPLYYDGVKYMDYVANEDFSGSLEAYSAPREFGECEGVKQLAPGLSVGQQPRKTFDLSYRTLIGNDLQGTDYGYKIHLVYNITVGPSGKSYKTLGNSGSGVDTRTWSLNAVPPPANNFKPTAHIVITSTELNPYILEELETVLYGRDATAELSARPAYLPTIEEILLIMGNDITEFIEATI